MLPKGFVPSIKDTGETPTNQKAVHTRRGKEKEEEEDSDSSGLGTLPQRRRQEGKGREQRSMQKPWAPCASHGPQCPDLGRFKNYGISLQPTPPKGQEPKEHLTQAGVTAGSHNQTKSPGGGQQKKGAGANRAPRPKQGSQHDPTAREARREQLPSLGTPRTPLRRGGGRWRSRKALPMGFRKTPWVSTKRFHGPQCPDLSKVQKLLPPTSKGEVSTNMWASP